MSKYLLSIDVSKSQLIEEDSIDIRFASGSLIQVKFSRLVSQSKYVRDKYKYSEAVNFFQLEIDKLENEFKIKEESIKHFIQLIQEEKVNISIEHYQDFCTLSEYFCIPRFTRVLDDIRQQELFNDLDFTIQLLLDSESAENDIETKLTSKIETFLSDRINECLKNREFSKLPITTIFRILNGSNKENINVDLLFDFIIESVDTRFILLKFVKLNKMTNDKVNEFLRFIEEEEEESREMYLEYMTFDILFIKQQEEKYNETNQKLDETKQELNETKQELNEIKQELNETKQELNEIKQELNETKQELNETKQELNETKQELNETKQELNEIKQELNETKQELNDTKQKCNEKKQKLNKYKSELNQSKGEKTQCTQTIIIAGNDRYNQLGEKPNAKDKDDDSIIAPSAVLSLDTSSLLSYSVYCAHSVLVTSDGSLKGIGFNFDCQISPTLQKAKVDNFTHFLIKDCKGRSLTAVSAVSCLCGTLYMFSKSSCNERQLVLCDKDINHGHPVFLDIGNHHPVSLFGGRSHSAAIGSEGEVIFINRNSVIKSPNSPIEVVSLPDGEKASSVACCDESVVVLSSNGRVFKSLIDSNRVLKFSPVSELLGEEIICVSGVYKHFLAVSKKGHVFGCGSNGSGQLGLGKESNSYSSFTEISSLVGYKIRAAYAGYNHSLFETHEGKILSCGYNECGQLLLNSGPSERVYSPTETIIKSGASFCIAGSNLSVIFIGNEPPPNIPNK